VSANERRAEIIRILESRKEETMQNLAFHLGVSIRTINYDIIALTTEYPIETVRGNGGCVRLMKGYHTYRNDITKEQQDLLLSLIDEVDESKAVVLRGLLRSHGSREIKHKIEGGS